MKSAWILSLILFVSFSTKTDFEQKLEKFKELKLPITLDSETDYGKDIDKDSVSLHRRVYGWVTFTPGHYGIFHLGALFQEESHPYRKMQLTLFDKGGRVTDSLVFFDGIGSDPGGGSTTEKVIVNADKTLTFMETYSRLLISADSPAGKKFRRNSEATSRITETGTIEKVTAGWNPEKSSNTKSLSDSLFAYTFTIDTTDRPNGKWCKVSLIGIYDLENLQMLQNIMPEENQFDCLRQGEVFFMLEDMNFDGVADFRLEMTSTGAGDIPYYYWIFNPQKRVFQDNDALGEIAGPQFDQVKKQIYSVTLDPVKGEMAKKTYRFVKGTPTLIMEESGKWNPDKDSPDTVKTVKKLINGRWEEVRK